jgi:phosphoribosylformimino-5-aminoimidazole carboxamide ribotide isomerase
MRLIPAIDLRGGQCVRLLHGDFAAETRYATTAEQLYERYAGLGAGWLHVVDLDGAREGAPRQLPVVRALASRGGARLQLGGGLRDRAAIGRAFESGASRVVVGSRALDDPAQVAGWLAELGGETLALAFDVRVGADGEPRLATHGWREQSESTLWQALAPFGRTGLRHVLCTDIGRDGALAGPNCELYREAVRRYPTLEWQASGGIRDAGDLWALRATGVAAAVSGRALLENLLSAEEMQPFLPAA